MYRDEVKQRHESMRLAARTKLCVAVNLIGLVGIIVFVACVADTDELFAYGPSVNLTVMAMRVDTWPKYVGLIAVTVVVKVLEVGVNDIGSPNLGFSIYDPTETVVYGFGRAELQLLANCMFMINSLGYVFKTLILVSRIDLAVISVVSGELASAATIYYLLGKKTQFYPEYDTRDEKEQADRELCDVHVEL